MNLIEEGMVVTNSKGELSTITLVTRGKYGFHLVSTCSCHIICSNGYVPFELPPIDRVMPWYGWRSRGYLILPTGIKVGTLNLGPAPTVEEYDAEWERTCEAIRKEEVTDVRI